MKPSVILWPAAALLLAASLALPATGETQIVVAGDAAATSLCVRRNPEETESLSVPCNERLAGDWGGMLTESTGEKYRVEISLQTGGGGGTIAYPKLNCSGTLDYLMRRGDTYVYRETITEGDKCVASGAVELSAVSADGSTFDFNWTGDGATVTGRLVGVLTAGATRTSGTTSKPGPDDVDECFKFLPNRGSLVDMPCDAGVTTIN